ncbi:flagellin [Candidatus Epulonipiscium fishelsonii]|uniref:Flagellin n=1 Tax=Candidatus Epulonipiscium fishelsonii TaxID=77094 RepID=A0ACC8XD66_9FIRM|nr:flagellin [Epulopiscium sp. SCG-B05WGA-EpuloA1]ONI40815.1 flagellin [Epulopiscium sp. SCG-B11WGA-EpuloA1]
MVVNTNTLSINAHRNMGSNTTKLGKASEKLSSGLRINRAADDAAGLAVSETMRSQIRGLNQASRNVQDGISFAQTAEGALDEVSAMLTRAKELLVQASTGTYSEGDRTNIQEELTALSSEIDNIITSTKFNGIAITTGASIATGHDGSLEILIPPVSDSEVSNAMDNIDLSGDTDGTDAKAGAILIEDAIQDITTQRAEIGAVQNRLEHTLENQKVTTENLTTSESRIRDTDMAAEMMNFTKFNVLNQAAQSMMAQANQIPNQALGLLG